MQVLLVGSGKAASIRMGNPRQWLHSLVLGALNPFLYYLVLFEAYALLPAQEAQALNYTWALTMALLAVPLLGHSLRAGELLAALVCYGGVLVIATRGQLLSLPDLLLVVADLGDLPLQLGGDLELNRALLELDLRESPTDGEPAGPQDR